jgi:hypothetical protein
MWHGVGHRPCARSPSPPQPSTCVMAALSQARAYGVAGWVVGRWVVDDSHPACGRSQRHLHDEPDDSAIHSTARSIGRDDPQMRPDNRPPSVSESKAPHLYGSVSWRRRGLRLSFGEFHRVQPPIVGNPFELVRAVVGERKAGPGHRCDSRRTRATASRPRPEPRGRRPTRPRTSGRPGHGRTGRCPAGRPRSAGRTTQACAGTRPATGSPTATPDASATRTKRPGPAARRRAPGRRDHARPGGGRTERAARSASPETTAPIPHPPPLRRNPGHSAPRSLSTSVRHVSLEIAEAPPLGRRAC